MGALIDGEKILEAILERFEEETGDQPTKEIVTEAFDEFVESEVDESDDSENEQDEEVETEQESEIDAEDFQSEMESALDNVRKLAAFQQEEFVNDICDFFGDVNGYEPTQNELVEIMAGIRADFADEAREEFLEKEDVVESEEDDDDEEESEDPEDSDYDPNDAEDIKQVQEDQDEDYSDSEESEESEDTQNID